MNWPILKIDDIKAPGERSIAIGPFGSRMKADQYVASGVPVIRGTNLTGGREFSGDFVYVSDSTADELRGSNVFADDLVFPHRGAIGEVGIVPHDEYQRYMLSTSLMKLTCNRDLVVPLYVFYFFKSAAGKQALLQHASVVGTPGIGQPLTSLRSIRIPVPPMEEQRAIVDLLGTLDDKIELNRRMSQTLEEIARTLFKSWFVDFDPVHAKAAGRQPVGMDAETAALFPSEFEESELGQIPKGWRVSTIGEEVKVVGGSTPSTSVSDFWEGGTNAWATPKDLAALQVPLLTSTERKITDLGVQQISSRQLPPGTLLMSSRAPVGYLAISQIPISINQGFIAMICDGIISSAQALWWAQENLEEIRGRANGTTFQEISKSNFRPIPIVVPAPEVATRFSDQATPLMERIALLIEESLTLKNLRDTLLPRLLSGELQLP